MGPHIADPNRIARNQAGFVPRITEYRSEAFLALMVLAVVLVEIFSFVELGTADRNLIDTDGYMRTVRVTELATGEVGWLDGWAHRSNAPDGHSMHWTRPLDVLILAASTWLLPFRSTADAVYWGAVLVSPLLLLILGLAIAWAARPLTGRHMAWLAGLIGVLQPIVLAYSQTGRVDHHTLMMVATTIMVGAAIRLAVSESDRHGVLAAVGGLAGALSLWVAVEALIWVGVVFAAGAIAWVTGQGPRSGVQRLWWSWFAGGVLGAAIIERGSAVVAALEYDRISLPHIALGAIAALFWIIIERANQRGRSTRERLSAAGVGVIVGAVAIGALFPSFYRGPLVDVSEELQRRWLSHVSEMQPVIDSGWATALAYLLVPVAGLTMTVVLVSRTSGRMRLGWGLLGMLLPVGIVLSVVAVRFTIFAEVFGAIPVAASVGFLIQRVQDRSPVLRLSATSGLLLLAMGAHFVPLVLSVGVSTPVASGDCVSRTVSRVVSRNTSSDGIVLANIDLGPEILFRTDARVIGAPYHRNAGNLDVLDAFASDTATVSRSVIADRGVTHVVFCTAVSREAADKYPEGSLARDLVVGQPPAYLVQIDSMAGWSYYRVIP